MNTILYFIVQAALTLVVSALIAGYLRRFLRNALVDLCGTEERAQFWTSFSNVLLIGMPMVFALNYKPEADSFETAFLEIAGKLGGNLAGLLFVLLGLGFAVSIFALFAPKPAKAETK